MTTPSKRSMERGIKIVDEWLLPLRFIDGEPASLVLTKSEKKSLQKLFALAFDRLVDEACEVASAQFSEHRRSEAKGIRHHCRGCELAQSIRLKLKGGEDGR